MMLVDLAVSCESKLGLCDTHVVTLSREINICPSHLPMTLETRMGIEMVIRRLPRARPTRASLVAVVAKFLSAVVPQGQRVRDHENKYGVKTARNRHFRRCEYVSIHAARLLRSVDAYLDHSNPVSAGDVYTAACCVLYGRSGRLRGFIADPGAAEASLAAVMTDLDADDESGHPVRVYDADFITESMRCSQPVSAMCIGHSSIKIISFEPRAAPKAPLRS